MTRLPLRPLCLVLLLAGCATAGQHAARPPASPDRLRLAAAAEANNNLDVALAIYRNAAAAEPENAEAQARYAAALARQGAHREAVLVLEQALARRPRDRGLLLALARTQLRANDPRGAAQSFQRLLDQAPGDAEALNGLGVIADLDGDHQLAQRHYREGLRHNPRHVGLRNNLALSLALSGAPAEAVDLLRGLREEGNTDMRVRHNLAFVHAMTGDHATARQLTGAELDPIEQQNLVAAAALFAAAAPAAARPSPPITAAQSSPAPSPARHEPPPGEGGTSGPAVGAASAVASARLEPPPAAPPAMAAGATASRRTESAAPAEGGARIVLEAKAESWVEVRERDSGRVLVDRVLAPGERWAVPNRAGLVLTTGNAAGLTLLVDGERLPPLPGRVRRNIPLEPAALRDFVAARPAPAAEPVPPAASPAAAPAERGRPAAIVLRARSETWVQVHDGESETVLFDRLMRPGDSYPVPPRPGLLLTTGNAAGLEVIVEGEVLPSLGGEAVVRRNVPLEPAALRRAALAAEQGEPSRLSSMPFSSRRTARRGLRKKGPCRRLRPHRRQAERQAACRLRRRPSGPPGERPERSEASSRGDRGGR